MGLHAWAIDTGSTAQGGTTGFDPRYISSSDATVPDGPLAKWYTYRILAKARPAEEQNIGLVLANPETIYDPGVGAYWEDVLTDPTIEIASGIISQKGFYMPRYKVSPDERAAAQAVASTSSWQWVQGLDLTIANYNENNPGDEYRPGFYGWILGVAKNGTTSGWNVEAWFWGFPGAASPSEVSDSFLAVVNSLPTGAYQPGQANDRTFTDAASAFDAICYSVVNKYDGFAAPSGFGSTCGNFVVVYNTGSVLGDVGVEYAIDVMDNSIW